MCPHLRDILNLLEHKHILKCKAVSCHAKDFKFWTVYSVLVQPKIHTTGYAGYEAYVQDFGV